MKKNAHKNTLSLARHSLLAKSKQRGLSLIELMVAMAIALVLLGVISLVYISTKNSFSYANTTTRMGEDASFAIEAISRDVRMAGYTGCAGANLSVNPGVDGILGNSDDIYDDPTLKASNSSPKLLNVAGYTPTKDMPNPFSAPVYSANSVILGFPNATMTQSQAAAAVDINTSTNYSLVNGMPILYLAGGSPQAVQIGDAVTKGTTPASSGRNSGNSVNIGADPHNFPPDTATTDDSWMIISDCRSSEIFKARKATVGGIRFMDSQSTLPSPATPTDFIFQNTYDTDAVITPLETTTYFLARRNGATTPSLYVRRFNGSTALTPQELVPNIEVIAYRYGINTTNNPTTGLPTYRPDAYVDSLAVTDWSRVVSLQIGFIVVSEDAGKAAGTQPASIEWIQGVGNNYVPANANDGRIRRAYSTTVSIRNRSGL